MPADVEELRGNKQPGESGSERSCPNHSPAARTQPRRTPALQRKRPFPPDHRAPPSLSLHSSTFNRIQFASFKNYCHSARCPRSEEDARKRSPTSHNNLQQEPPCSWPRGLLLRNIQQVQQVYLRFTISNRTSEKSNQRWR